MFAPGVGAVVVVGCGISSGGRRRGLHATSKCVHNDNGRVGVLGGSFTAAVDGEVSSIIEVMV